MRELELNYAELAFVMGLTVKESKEIFLNLSKNNKVGKNDLISVDVLMDEFPKTHSVDPRYHGLNSLLFTLENCKIRYKNYLSDKACIKKKTFTGGKSVFNKLLSKEEIDFCEEQFRLKYDYLGLGKGQKE